MKLCILSNNKGGAVLLIFLALTLLMTIFLGYSYFTTNQKIAKEELQAASDAAALAAVKELCHDVKCYNYALRKAADTLLAYSSRNSLGKKIPLLTAHQAENFYHSSSNTIGEDNVSITIERGRWFTTADNEERFESFEIDNDGNTWEDKYPGVPIVMAANAVRVAITVESPFSFFSNNAAGKITNSAIAVWGEGNISTCTAPFAIPVCALLDAAGKFDALGNCAAERFFTRSDRYCQSEPGAASDGNCGIRPGFIYNLEQAVPPSSLGITSNKDLVTECKINAEHPRPLNYLPWLDAQNILGTTSEEIESIEQIPFGWCNNTFKSPSDHFALLGVPEEESNINLDQALERDCLPMKIGQNFKIFKEGFSEFDSKSAQGLETLLSNKIFESQNANSSRLAKVSPLPFPKNMRSSGSPDEPVPPGGYILTADAPVERGFYNDANDDTDQTQPSPTETSTPAPTETSIPLEDDSETTETLEQPNLLERSAQVAGLCRSARATLKCGTAQFEGFNPELSLDQLTHSSIHFPPNLYFMDIPELASNISSTNHPCYLNLQGEQMQAYLYNLKQQVLDCSANPDLTNCHKAPSLESVERRIDDTQSYLNLKAVSNKAHEKDEDLYWLVKVPVIADFAANTDCSSDPGIQDEHNFQIIGFIDVQIFDYDISGTEALNAYGEVLEIATGPFPSHSETGLVNWYFSNINGQPEPCNLIRGRVACESKFIGSANDSYDPELVRPALRE